MKIPSLRDFMQKSAVIDPSKDCKLVDVVPYGESLCLPRKDGHGAIWGDPAQLGNAFWACPGDTYPKNRFPPDPKQVLPPHEIIMPSGDVYTPVLEPDGLYTWEYLLTTPIYRTDYADGTYCLSTTAPRPSAKPINPDRVTKPAGKK